jgi:hypothetical protein
MLSHPFAKCANGWGTPKILLRLESKTLLSETRVIMPPVEGIRGGFFLGKKPLGARPPGTATLVSL